MIAEDASKIESFDPTPVSPPADDEDVPPVSALHVQQTAISEKASLYLEGEKRNWHEEAIDFHHCNGDPSDTQRKVIMVAGSAVSKFAVGPRAAALLSSSLAFYF